ncbi:conserved hypothetical protein [Candida dubliniensis CD36]|uniref:Elongin-A n=1 Tax=Candida dubliniensis (strain CD36 / ATCC MYA-646 / CBS 7987 / NCPF 3949 / NRRL Y-17841) TaxID=573826 RepID=B9W7F6_CANDC|nr:conserved hypothetical protein [Candida dubliniensis CD36]CAX44615.1 conserved hypothetical protein [Candida dubliniensis CD36]
MEPLRPPTQIKKSTKKLPSLVDISLLKIKKHIHSLTDIGTTPYHLLEPVLQQIPAKQLNELELNCQQLLPYSDKLWMKLIQKDFPDRPTPPPSSSSTTTPIKLNPKIKAFCGLDMPYKSLYYKYCQDRDEFRKDSAKRLRHANKSLERQKSKNKIVAIDEVLRDPTIKSRRFYDLPSYTTNTRRSYGIMGNKNSILEKAKRDTMINRTLIFGNANANRHLNSYDPFDAFKVDKNSSISTLSRGSKFMRPPKTTTTTSSTTSNVRPGVRRTTFFNSAGSGGQSTNLSTTKSSNSTNNIPNKLNTNTVTDNTKSNLNTSQQKCSTKPSIFLHSKRKSTIMTNDSPLIKKKKPRKQNKQSEMLETKETPSKLKPLKSSIFS